MKLAPIIIYHWAATVKPGQVTSPKWRHKVLEPKCLFRVHAMFSDSIDSFYFIYQHNISYKYHLNKTYINI